MARRGRKAKGGMSLAELKEREKEAALILGSGRKKRGRKARKASVITRVFNFAAPKRKRRSSSAVVYRSSSIGPYAGGASRKVKKMRKSKKGGSAAMSYSQVTSNLPIQAGMQISEALFALGSVSVDIYTTASKSAADDVGFPIAQYAIASGGRYLAQKYLARKHPGLAAVASHGFSAANGDRVGNLLRSKFASFLNPQTRP